MNICLLCRNFHKDLGGIETFTRSFAAALAEHGHAVHILCEDKGDFSRDRIAERVTVHHVAFNDHPFPGAWSMERLLPLEDWRYSLAAARAIDDLACEVDLDIVESFDYFRQGFVYTHRKKRTPVFLRLHGWFFSRTDGRVDPWPTLSFRERISWRMHRDTLLKADGVAAVAADTGDFAKKVWRITRDIPTIYNAVDTERFVPASVKDSAQILFAGRLIPRKGVDVLAEAMTLVIQECPRVRLVVAGADDVLADSQKSSDMLLKRIGAEHMRYLGQVSQDELKGWLAKSAVLTMPSLDEAFPMSALEGMASGCALVSSTAGGLKELIDHDQDGLLVEPGDAQGLAGALIRLLKDPALCRDLAQKGLDKVKIKYSYTALVRESIAAYEQAIHAYQMKEGNP